MTGLEPLLIKLLPTNKIIDILVKSLKKIQGKKRKTAAEKGLSDAIQELMKNQPNLNLAAAKIESAREADSVSEGLFFADTLIAKLKTLEAKEKPKIGFAKKAAASKTGIKITAVSKTTTKKAPAKIRVKKTTAIKAVSSKKYIKSMTK
jgi:hypothetical protein